MSTDNNERTPAAAAPAQAPLSIHGTHWEREQLRNVESLLDMLSAMLGSSRASEAASVLRIVRDGNAEPLSSCGTIAASGLESRYPVFCGDCAPHMGTVSPQRMVLRCDSPDGDEPVWVAASFGIGFVLKVIGRDNTLEAAEVLLDTLATEADVEHLKALIDADGSDSGTPLLAN